MTFKDEQQSGLKMLTQSLTQKGYSGSGIISPALQEDTEENPILILHHRQQ